MVIWCEKCIVFHIETVAVEMFTLVYNKYFMDFNFSYSGKWKKHYHFGHRSRSISSQESGHVHSVGSF